MTKRFVPYALSILLLSHSGISYSADDDDSSISFEDITCPNAEIFSNLITDFCWSCMFPIYLGGIKIWGDSDDAPSGRSSDSFCYCSGELSDGEIPQVGVTMGMWYPNMMLEVTARPYCFPALLGLEMGDYDGMVSKYNQGNESNDDSGGVKDTQQSSYSWHQYSFPVTEALELFEAPGCSYEAYDFLDVAWMSETLSSWYDAELALYISPEAVLFATPLTLLAMMVDCTVTTADEPMDESYYTAGCWGEMYPLTQDVGNSADKVSNKSLAATRALFFLARMGILESTMGDEAICEPQEMYTLVKSEYRMQQLWPMSESASDSGISCQDSSVCEEEWTSGVSVDGSNTITISSADGDCCHAIGESTFNWGVWRDAYEDSFAIYAIFQWKNCCLSYL